MQKKTFALLGTLVLTTTLFAGCFNNNADQATAVKPATSSETATKNMPLTEKNFIALSAEILCLSKNNPNAPSTEVEAKAKALAKKYGVTETAYSEYQRKIEANPDEKTRIGYAIIGKMGELCTNQTTTPNTVTTPDTQTTNTETKTSVTPATDTPSENPAPATTPVTR